MHVQPSQPAQPARPVWDDGSNSARPAKISGNGLLSHTTMFRFFSFSRSKDRSSALRKFSACIPASQAALCSHSSDLVMLKFHQRSEGIRYSLTRPRPASPALTQMQPSACPRLRLCCLVFHARAELLRINSELIITELLIQLNY